MTEEKHEKEKRQDERQEKDKRTHFETDDAGADHDHALGDFLDVQGARRGDNAFFIDRKRGKSGRLRTSGQNNVVGIENLGGTVVHLDADFVVSGQRTETWIQIR
jgi:hypothetical protein